MPPPGERPSGPPPGRMGPPQGRPPGPAPKPEAPSGRGADERTQRMDAERTQRADVGRHAEPGRRVAPADRPNPQRRTAADTRPPAGPPPGGSGGSGGEAGDGAAKKAKRKRRWRTVRRTLYTLFALALVLPLLAFLVAYVSVVVPKPGDIQTNQVATILAGDGTSVLAKVVPPEGNRTDVGIEQVPPHVRNAVIAAEDRDFYTNPGFSISGFTRALRDNLLGKESAGGGSTITQQYVKNALVGDERTITRKMHELVISSKMARSWSKDEILSAYLNTIYFGRGSYGIAAASKAYFNKPVEQLTVEEGAVLAATIQLPSSLDPEKNPKGAQERWSYVLDGMVSSGTLDGAQRAAMKYPMVVPLNSLPNPNQDNGPEGLIKSKVLQELSAAGVSEHQLNTEGLQITTTIDPKMQKSVVDAVNKNMEGEPPVLRTAAVSVDPRTGAVKAYYGGNDGKGFDFANSGLQTGSSFKVFGLAANLDQGIPLSKMYDSSPLTVHGIKITNVEGESCGTCTIAEALKRSLNTSFYRMMLGMENGSQKIADMAHRLGIPKELPGIGPTLTEPNNAGPSDGIVLGQYQSRVIDMASAYATLAASGMYHQPYFIQKVTTADGEVLLDRGAPQGQQVVDKAVADNVTSAMRPIAGYSRGHNLAGGRQSAAKTGTAQLGDTGENKDAWMVGYTPSLSTAVWIGTEQGLPLTNVYGGSIYGSGLPADIWKDAMDGALKGTDNENFPNPGSIAGQAGVPAYTAPYTAPRTTAPPTQSPGSGGSQPPPVVRPTDIEILPGIRIPVPGAAPQTQSPRTQQPQTTQPDPGPLPGQPSDGGDDDGEYPFQNSQPTTRPGGLPRPNG